MPSDLQSTRTDARAKNLVLRIESTSNQDQTFREREGLVRAVDSSEKSFVLAQRISRYENSVPRFELAGRHLAKETETL